MIKFGVGQPVQRVEDARFLSGQGRYLDDIHLPGEAHGFVLRSPHAHARIKRLETAAARAAPGVLAVFTGADHAADGLGPIPCGQEIKQKNGEKQIVPPRHALPRDRVRHVGDAVAFVVAETAMQARDAAELIEVAYDELPTALDPATADRDGQPQIWPEAPRNLCFDWEKGDAAATRAALAAAHRVVRLELVNNRVMVHPMEARGAIGEYDSETGRYTLTFSGQAAHNLRRQICDGVFRIPHDRMRLVIPDVGGGFGVKNFVYPEYIMVLHAARRLGRPVRWVSDRTEAFLADAHGRDNITKVALGLDRSNRFTALEVETYANMGGYLSTNGPIIPTGATAVVLGGVYDIPAIYYNCKGVFTNTAPVDAYRGAGRPEAAYLLERTVDVAAREIGIDPAELRRLNYIRPDQMPYKTAMGNTLDCGEFAENLNRALALIDHKGFALRRAAAKAEGNRRGLGIASYFEATLGPPLEQTAIRFEWDGTVTLVIGTQSNGQGHHTAFAQLVYELLGVPLDRLRFVQGDTDKVPIGGGHGGSRSIQLGGSALVRTAEKIIAKGKQAAAHFLETAAADIEFADGTFRVAGTDRAIGLIALAQRVRAANNLPAELATQLQGGLDDSAQYTRENYTFPNGCHVCEIEVDGETGVARVVGYAVIDDFGRVINPLLVEGQVDGGVVMGIGQALLERTVYDPDGQLLSGSFMDYCMPRADDVPPITFALNEVPTKTNPLGVKGCAEAGCIGALPAVMNALCDALDVRHIDMPATPETIWRTMLKET
ncbi:MAG: xanthine dehydrogenase family protein molybdopterin-binding subunit [Alphaproteobacteria bacterium]|nr:xanthine dehydrogenase family protein molybdopterin-binding subunit [Alphaproteobacteria bacterium]